MLSSSQAVGCAALSPQVAIVTRVTPASQVCGDGKGRRGLLCPGWISFAVVTKCNCGFLAPSAGCRAACAAVRLLCARRSACARAGCSASDRSARSMSCIAAFAAEVDPHLLPPDVAAEVKLPRRLELAARSSMAARIRNALAGRCSSRHPCSKASASTDHQHVGTLRHRAGQRRGDAGITQLGFKLHDVEDLRSRAVEGGG